MKKTIEIIGKNNIDAINGNKKKATRTNSKTLNIDENLFNHTKQREIINNIYLNNLCELNNEVMREIKCKLDGYKQQDLKKDIFNKEKFITYEIILEKLVESKLICKYCNCNLNIIYNLVRQKDQWTLDRIDNGIGHNSCNVVISCLECNLKRRNTNYNSFLFTKKLKIKKNE